MQSNFSVTHKWAQVKQKNFNSSTVFFHAMKPEPHICNIFWLNLFHKNFIPNDLQISFMEIPILNVETLLWI
jgi:hypothetical protein